MFDVYCCASLFYGSRIVNVTDMFVVSWHQPPSPDHSSLSEVEERTLVSPTPMKINLASMATSQDSLLAQVKGGVTSPARGFIF